MICKGCGTEFDSMSDQRIFCSDRCRNRSNYVDRCEQEGRILHKVVCAMCGTEFETRSTIKKYCSLFCNERANGGRKCSCPQIA